MSKIASILVVDDELSVLKAIKLILESAGYLVLTAQDGIQALNVLQAESVDLILADIAMPNMNGYQLYKRVRENPDWVTLPFVFLTARALNSDIRYGKEMGVDDYLTKPFQVRDLLAIVRGKLCRAQQLARSPIHSTLAPPILTVGSLRINSNQHRVWLGEQEFKLSAREFVLLEHLARQAGNVVSSQELIQVTHNLEAPPSEAGSLLRPLIFSLRRKLGYAVSEKSCVENLRGVGYRLTIPAG